MDDFLGIYGGLSLSDESFPNGGARGAFAKPSFQRPRRLDEALVKTSRTFHGAVAKNSAKLVSKGLRDCSVKASRSPRGV